MKWASARVEVTHLNPHNYFDLRAQRLILNYGGHAYVVRGKKGNSPEIILMCMLNLAMAVAIQLLRPHLEVLEEYCLLQP